MDNNRRRADLRVVRIRQGNCWDHTGTRQTTLYMLRDERTGEEYRFDSFAEWRRDSIHRVSFATCEDTDYITNPRPVRGL